MKPIIVVDPELMNGIPCFRGTRVPLDNLIHYLQDGYTIPEILEEFPSITQEMAIQALEECKDALYAKIGTPPR